MESFFRNTSYVDRLSEDELYTRIYEEIENGEMDKAAQARAIEEGGSDNGAVKKAYIKHRMARIRAEIDFSLDLAKHNAEKLRKQKEEQEILKEQETQRRIREEVKNRRANVIGRTISLLFKVPPRT